ncbi:MAG: T9SS type A sorting domain-containing protein [candidate division WOR-3 bacterium]
MWLIILYLDIQTKGGKGAVNESTKEQTTQSVYMPKTDNGNYKIAPFFGWTPEKEEIANAIRQGKINVDENFLKIRIERLDSFYAQRWQEEKPYVCGRYAIKGLECPNIHPHMNRIYYYYNKWKNENDAWAYAEMITLIEDGERLLSAYENTNSTQREPLNKAKIASASHIKLAKNGNNFSVLTDGNGWNTFPISATTGLEYNPTIVQMGNEDTLFAGLNVYPCSVLGSGFPNYECILIARSDDAGKTWTGWIIIYLNSGNLGEVAIGADPYRRFLIVTYRRDDYGCWLGNRSAIAGWVFYDKNNYTINSGEKWILTPSSFTCSPNYATPYVNTEFNWGRSGCMGLTPGACACDPTDIWYFVGANKGGGGVSIARSTTCGSSWSQVYDGPARNGSAYNNNQIMLETTNDPRGSSSVCTASNGGDNTIQAVYDWRNSTTDHRIEHLFTDAAGGWGSTWTSTTVLSGYAYPINQPWLSVARRLTNSNMTHFLVFESQFSSTDGDIRYIRASGIPPSGWSAVQNIDFSTVDSRTPTVHTDARWQWCPGATTSSANYFHVAFYHRCPNTYDGSLCNAPYTSYNNTFRVAVLRYNWDLTQSGPEICGNLVADTIAIPPPPSYSGGGLWQNWWQINGTTFRTTQSLTSPWWFGAMWVYCYNRGPDGICGTSDDVDWNMEWTILSYSCITPVSKDELKEGKDFIIKGKLVEIYLNNDWEFKVYDVSGRKLFEIKGKGNSKFNLNLPKGAYIYKINDKFGKFIL